MERTMADAEPESSQAASPAHVEGGSDGARNESTASNARLSREERRARILAKGSARLAFAAGQARTIDQEHTPFDEGATADGAPDGARLEEERAESIGRVDVQAHIDADPSRAGLHVTEGSEREYAPSLPPAPSPPQPAAATSMAELLEFARMFASQRPVDEVERTDALGAATAENLFGSSVMRSVSSHQGQMGFGAPSRTRDDPTRTNGPPPSQVRQRKLPIEIPELSFTQRFLVVIFSAVLAALVSQIWIGPFSCLTVLLACELVFHARSLVSMLGSEVTLVTLLAGAPRTWALMQQIYRECVLYLVVFLVTVRFLRVPDEWTT